MTVGGRVVGLVWLCGCGLGTVGPTAVGQSSEALNVTHTFDFAAEMPPHLAVMFSMSWFGIPASDPQGAGPDPSYGNTQWNGACAAANDPSRCGDCLLYGAGDACLKTGSMEREMASRRRPLAGIYSASAVDPEGEARVDLMLSTLRRPCDDGAKLDAWTLQLNGTRDTTAHPSSPRCATCEIAYQATQGFLRRADLGGMNGVVIPGDDATWYFHFGGAVGLGACNDSPNNPRQNCIDALTQDAVDMVTLAVAHPSALRVAGKPVLFFYLDPGHLSATEWSSIFQNARSVTGLDFYTVAALQNPTRSEYFAAFDALAPWIQLDWSNTGGGTVRAHAAAWAAGQHQALFSALSQNPGRVVFGGVAPGFDDYTMSWGACVERQLPPGAPRDPALLQGEFDYLASQGVRGMIFETWDDWTEGSEFEPDVEGGPAVLVELRQQLSQLLGEPSDSAGDARLAALWNGYGQARNCSGGPAGMPPVIALSCADAGTPDAGSETPPLPLPLPPGITQLGLAPSAGSASKPKATRVGCSEGAGEPLLAALLAASLVLIRRRRAPG